MYNIGFIILRHVRCDKTGKYWINAYNNIRRFYPENWIMIIDDNSNYNFIEDIPLYKTTIFNNEYPARGELLPYIYYLDNKLFDIAFIIHDSVSLNKYFNYTEIITNTYKFLWDFESKKFDTEADEMVLFNELGDNDLIELYNNKHLWRGCFGCMTIINHHFLKAIDYKYNLRKLIKVVTNRTYRCALERVLACILHKEGAKETLLGDIHKYCNWDIEFDDIQKYDYLPLIKFWTGR